MDYLISTNPSNNYEPLGKVAVSAEDEIIEKVNLANAVKESWGTTQIKDRLKLMEKLYQKIEENRERMAKLIAQEMGMPISVIDSMEIGSGLEYFKWYLENSEKYL